MKNLHQGQLIHKKVAFIPDIRVFGNKLRGQHWHSSQLLMEMGLSIQYIEVIGFSIIDISFHECLSVHGRGVASQHASQVTGLGGLHPGGSLPNSVVGGA